MSARLAVLLAAFVLALPLSARADGKVFSQVTAVKTTTPDQRALVHFADGTETLVVETSFVGAGTNFAWVVPLPAAPEISAVPRTVFTNLERLFQPEVIHKQIKWWIGMLFVAVLLGTLLRSLGQPGGLLQWLVLAVLFLFLLGLFLPSLAKAKGSASISIAQAGVQILARQTVGVFDTVTLSSPDGAALTRWLNEHGFAVPAAAAPVIADYAKQGWVFAAAKLSRPDASGKTSPHPLAFKFKTDRAVYPLRLTGVENDRCLVELYVFGASRAELPGFKVEQCLATEFPKELPPGTRVDEVPDQAALREAAPGQLRLRHPALRSLVAGAAVGTKLTATLDAAGMSRDAFVDWIPFERRLASLYSHEAASIRAMNLGVAVLLLTLPVVGFWLWRCDGEWTLRLLARVFGGATLVGLVYFVALPKVEVEVKRGWRYHANARLGSIRQLWVDVEVLAYELKSPRPDLRTEGPWTVKALRRAVLKASPSGRAEEVFSLNLLTGEPLREEATPGNLLFRPTARGTEVLWHDVDCVEHVLATLPVRTP